MVLPLCVDDRCRCIHPRKLYSIISQLRAGKRIRLVKVCVCAADLAHWALISRSRGMVPMASYRQITSRAEIGPHMCPAPHTRTTFRRRVMRLRSNQVCLIHRSRFWCGREEVPKSKAVRQLGVRRIEDSLYPRGYLELRPNG